MTNFSYFKENRVYGLVAIRDFTMDKIHAASPAKGWTMRNIQALAAEEFPLWEKEHVCNEVRRVVLQHCNIKE
tara:strand:+ start:602 stop:820 length:219 start_codon:yes stop_codon:yes gene_type:complete